MLDVETTLDNGLLFSICRRILTHLYQTAFENVVAKGELDHNDQFLHLSQWFQ